MPTAQTLLESLAVTPKLLVGLATVLFFSFFDNLLLLISPIYMIQVFDGVRSHPLSRIGGFWDQFPAPRTFRAFRQ